MTFSGAAAHSPRRALVAASRTGWLRPGRLVAVVLAVLLLGYAALGAWAVLAVKREAGWLSAAGPTDATDGSLNVLLIGTDATGIEPGRADTLMLIHLPRDRSAVYLMSLPRMLQASMSQGPVELRTARQVGGVPLTVRAVEQLTGLRLQHAVETDFAGFAGLTEVVGGVTVHNPRASIADGGRSLPAGEVTLSGADALLFVRDHSVTDDVRTERQRAVLKAILAKLPLALANPLALARLSTDCLTHVTADDRFVQALPDLIGRLAAGRDRVVGVPVPLLPRANEWDQPRLDPRGMAVLAAAMRDGSMGTYRPERP